MLWHRQYLAFVRGVSVNRLGKLGIALISSSFVTFVMLELARLLGLLTNTYVGLITYLLFPALFVLGLLLLPLAWRQQLKRTGLSARELLKAQFDSGFVSERFTGSRVFRNIAVMTLLNIIILSAASSRMLAFMDEPEFCGTACHSVMHPEWATFQQSSHARVRCVDCHVGEGVDALVDSKLNGMWQMISVTFGLYERPIPTPVHNLRPARETCEKCHWPSKFYGDRLMRRVHYGEDEKSTPRYTTLSLKIDTGPSASKTGIHWHIDSANEITYVASDEGREEMLWVESRQADGTLKRFTNKRRRVLETNQSEPRTMDCVDCHNRATHVYEDPARAVDERLARGLIPADLPFIKRESVRALRVGGPDTTSGLQAIEDHLYGFYRNNFPKVFTAGSRTIDQAIAVLKDVYRRNIHPTMNVDWNPYPDHRGHKNGGGCFRCHNQNLLAEDGTGISHDCTMCHSILAYDSEQPFDFLLPPDSTDPTYQMHQYLHREFINENRRDTASSK